MVDMLRGIGGSVWTYVAFAAVATWALAHAARRRRTRGYLFLPPPGKHSIGRKRGARGVARSGARTERAVPSRRATVRASSEMEPAQQARGGAGSSGAARHLVAPVELWFGTTCVGVEPGSAMHRRFDHYARQLLAEMSDPLAGQPRPTDHPRRRRERRPVRSV